MAIAFTCPSCGKSLQLPDHAAGKTGKCKACGARIAIPADDAVEADSYAVIEPEPSRPADPLPAPTLSPRSPTAEASPRGKHAKPASSQGVRWGIVLATGTAALVFVGVAVILLLPAFSAARRKASEAV